MQKCTGTKTERFTPRRDEGMNLGDPKYVCELNIFLLFYSHLFLVFFEFFEAHELKNSKYTSETGL